MPPPETLDSYLTADALSSLMRLVFLPATICVRTLEVIDLSTGTPVRQTTQELRITSEFVLVPISSTRRGQLVDSLRIESSPGVNPYVLGRDDTLRVTTAVLRAAARAAEQTGSIPDDVIDQICVSVPMSDTQSAMKIISDLRRLFIAGRTDRKMLPGQVGFISALQRFARRQLLLVPCQPQSLMTKITYSRDVTNFEMQESGWREASRSAFGRSPDKLKFFIPLATKSKSYHFRLKVPSDYYIREFSCHRKLRRDARLDAHTLWTDYDPVPELPETVVGLHPTPTELAHVKISDADQLPRLRHGLVLRVGICERPLGRIGAATARVLVATLAAVLLPISGSQIVISGTPAITSVLLGLPALLGASLLVSRQGGRVRDPLFARLSTGLSVVISVAVSLVFSVWVVDASQAKVRVPKLTHFDAPGGVSKAFIIIQVLSGLLLAGTALAAFSNALAYTTALRKYPKL